MHHTKNILIIFVLMEHILRRQEAHDGAIHQVVPKN
jgi:hypothetical protein